MRTSERTVVRLYGHAYDWWIGGMDMRMTDGGNGGLAIRMVIHTTYHPHVHMTARTHIRMSTQHSVHTDRHGRMVIRTTGRAYHCTYG